MKILKKIAMVLVVSTAVMALTGAINRPVGECPVVDDSFVVLLASATDCSYYFECSDGIPLLKQCPGTLYFNPNLLVCDYPETAGCAAGYGSGGGSGGSGDDGSKCKKVTMGQMCSVDDEGNTQYKNVCMCEGKGTLTCPC